MFGNNAVTSPFPKVDGSLLVNELWPTIQGEGPDAGTPAIFVRLAKCNLRCHFCDTEFETGVWMDVVELASRISSLAGDAIKLVVLTGGEPLLQNIAPLVATLNTRGMCVSVETAGTVFCPGIEYLFGPFSMENNLIVCSPKTPKLNEDLIPLIGAYKYIIGEFPSEEDGLPVLSTQIENEKSPVYRPGKDSVVPIFVQPMDVGEKAANEALIENTVDIAMKYGYRISLQTHKILGLR